VFAPCAVEVTWRNRELASSTRSARDSVRKAETPGRDATRMLMEGHPTYRDAVTKDSDGCRPALSSLTCMRLAVGHASCARKHASSQLK
jgi:hypothetical protein